VEASTIPTTWRRWKGGRAFRSTTSASASVPMPGCICGTQGGRSSTWTGDHVHHSLPFSGTIDENAKAALVAAARKELVYLEKFFRLLLPFQRERRDKEVTFRPHQESRMLPSHRTLVRPQELSPPSFPYQSSRSPA